MEIPVKSETNPFCVSKIIKPACFGAIAGVALYCGYNILDNKSKNVLKTIGLMLLKKLIKLKVSCI